MLANTYIPVLAIVLGLFVATLTVIPSLLIEAWAVRSGTYRDTERFRRTGIAGVHPRFSAALVFAFIANAASTMPGFATAFYFLDYNTPWIWLGHYAITVAIEMPVYLAFGMRPTKRFVATVLGANMITYALMYALIKLLD